MTLPDAVRQAVERALAAHGPGRRVVGATTVGGGCINNGARIETDTGTSLFIKWNPHAPAGMFVAEADGLAALAGSTPLRVPEVVAMADEESTIPWLLLEHIADGPADHDALRRLGGGLAATHRAPAAATFGWERDNWIGSLAQSNEPDTSWALF